MNLSTQRQRTVYFYGSVIYVFYIRPNASAPQNNNNNSSPNLFSSLSLLRSFSLPGLRPRHATIEHWTELSMDRWWMWLLYFYSMFIHIIYIYIYIYYYIRIQDILHHTHSLTHTPTHTYGMNNVWMCDGFWWFDELRLFKNNASVRFELAMWRIDTQWICSLQRMER